MTGTAPKNNSDDTLASHPRRHGAVSVSFRRLQMKSIPCWWCGEAMWLESPEHLACHNEDCESVSKVDSLNDTDGALVSQALEWMGKLYEGDAGA